MTTEIYAFLYPKAKLNVKISTLEIEKALKSSYYVKMRDKFEKKKTLTPQNVSISGVELQRWVWSFYGRSLRTDRSK